MKAFSICLGVGRNEGTEEVVVVGGGFRYLCVPGRVQGIEAAIGGFMKVKNQRQEGKELMMDG